MVARFLRQLARRHCGLLARMTLSLLLLSVTHALLLVVLGPLASLLFAGGETISLAQLVPATLRAWVPSVTRPVEEWVALVPIAMVVIALVRGLSSYAFQGASAVLALRAARDYRSDLFARILALPYDRVRRRSPGAWMSRLMNDVFFIQSRLGDLLTGFLRDGAILIGCVVALMAAYPMGALIVAAVLPLGSWVLGHIARRISALATAYQAELAELSSRVLDLRDRFDFIHSQGGHEREGRVFADADGRYLSLVERSIAIRTAFAPAVELAGFLALALFLGWQATGGGGPAAAPTVFAAALGAMIRPLRSLGEQWSKVAELRGALASGVEEEPAASEPAPAGPAIAGSVLPVRLERVVAGSGTATTVTVRGLELRAGETVAIVGPSGAGKSLLIKTLAGLSPPVAWEGSLPWRDWTRRVALVSQEPFLFSGKLRGNLTYGLGADPTPDQLEHALGVAQIAAGDLPQGLETEYRALRPNISGGQAQRLVIARALLRCQEILLLDEATSALDRECEEAFLRALVADARRRGGALISVTHRLECLPLFDRVIALEAGAVRFTGLAADYQAFTAEEARHGAR